MYFKTRHGALLQLLSKAIISNHPIFYHLEFTQYSVDILS